MKSLILAQMAPAVGPRTWSLADLLIGFVIVLGLFAIALIVARVLGFVIPSWFWQICGVVILIVVAIVAIKFLLTL